MNSAFMSIQASSMPRKRLAVYMALLSFQGKKKSCFPRLKAIAQRLQENEILMSEKAVSKHIAKLQETGWISVKRTGRASTYEIYDSPRSLQAAQREKKGESESLSIMANQNRPLIGESESPPDRRFHIKQQSKTTFKTTTHELMPQISLREKEAQDREFMAEIRKALYAS